MCEKCLYKNNCQFLAKHKTVEVECCTAFISEDEYKVTIKNEAIKEFAERVKNGCGRVKTEGHSMLVCQEKVFDDITKEMMNLNN